MIYKDEQIIQMYLDRNDNAMSVTAEKYGNFCHEIANSILKSEEDIVDCMSQVYWSVWKRISVDKPKDLKLYLARATRYCAFQKYKKQSYNNGRRGRMAIVLNELSRCMMGEYPVGTGYDHEKVNAGLNKFLGSISKEKCAIFIYRYWYVKHVSDIASLCGISEQKVQRKLRRMRRKLRRNYYERINEEDLFEEVGRVDPKYIYIALSYNRGEKKEAEA